MEKPITTLFMLMSIDGKITSGNSDMLDADKDWKMIDGVKQGIQQYYDLEQCTDLWSLNTGRVMAKVGVNTKNDEPSKTPVSFVLIDNKPHLTSAGINYLSKWLKQVVIVTTNKNHPAITMNLDNVYVEIQDELHVHELLHQLKTIYNVERLTIQSGGTLNGLFLREKCFDIIDVVVAPLLVGGKDTSTLIDGASITTANELSLLSACRLIECQQLENSFVRLRYEVIHNH